MSEEGFRAKVVYRPPEKCYSDCWLVQTAHGYKVYRQKGDARPVQFIPHSAVKSIDYRGERR